MDEDESGMLMSTDIAWIKAALLRALRALAADGETALASYSDGCAKADELAQDYSHFLDCVVSNCPGLLSSDQVRALQGIDAMLGDMSGLANAELWTEHAVQAHSTWAAVRERARAAVPAVEGRLE